MFFLTHAPRKHWTANEWRKQNEETTSPFVTPEVVFLGRSNVGKSSLLNALLHSPGLNYVGSRPGKTTTMHAWGVAPSDPVTGGAVKGFRGDTDVKVAVLDMPGYGHGSRDGWGNEIIKYLRRRKQLRRAFLLLHSEHGVKEMDRKMLALLRSEGISHQIVATKCDMLTSHDQLQKSLGKMQRFLVEGRDSNRTSAVEEIIAVGGAGDGRKNDHVKSSSMRGIDALRWAVLQAAGLVEYVSKGSIAHAAVKQNANRTSAATSILLQDGSLQHKSSSELKQTPPTESTGANPFLEWSYTDENPPTSAVPSKSLPYNEPPTNRPSNKVQQRTSLLEPPQELQPNVASPRKTSPPPPSWTSPTPTPQSPMTPSPNISSTTTEPKPKFTPHIGGMAELLAMSQPKRRPSSPPSSTNSRPPQFNRSRPGRRHGRPRPHLSS